MKKFDAEQQQPLNDALFQDAFLALKMDDFTVHHDDQPVRLLGELGTGGTKTVYDALVNDEPFALALPNTVDNADVAQQKWEDALREPRATNTLRALGLMVNPICETLPVTINETPFPALKLTRYSDLPWQIRDRKNPTSSVIKTDVFQETTLDFPTFLDRTAKVQQDIAALLRHGVRMGSDSFNLCIVDNDTRLYVNDLGNAKFAPIAPNEAQAVAEHYSMNAIGAIMNGLSHAEYKRHQRLFDEEFGFKGRGIDILAQNVLSLAIEPPRQ